MCGRTSGAQLSLTDRSRPSTAWQQVPRVHRHVLVSVPVQRIVNLFRYRFGRPNLISILSVVQNGLITPKQKASKITIDINAC